MPAGTKGQQASSDEESRESSDSGPDSTLLTAKRSRTLLYAGIALVVVGVICIGAGWLAAHGSHGGSSNDCRGFVRCPAYPAPYLFGRWPESYDYVGTFPEGFVWGLGTASYQIEGAYKEDGRGASIWDTFTGADTLGMPGGNCSYCCTATPCPINKAMKDVGATGNVAADSYHLHATDVALMKAMGLKHYRFSIAWPRMFPTGAASGDPNPEAVAWYSNFINELLAAGITPYVTLYHWDLPQALLSPPEWQGWWSRDAQGQPNGQIIPNFNHYADTCFRLFGDRVKAWITFNEPFTFLFLASGYGKAPSIETYSNMSIDPWIGGHNVLNAHAAAVDIYRKKYQSSQQGKIGITNNYDWKEPKTTAPEDIAAAERSHLFNLGWFCEPIFGGNGDYPPEMRQLYGSRLPQFTAEQKALLKGSADFFGLNHYGTGWASNSDEPGSDTSYSTSDEDGFPRAQSTWLYGAGWGLRKLLSWIKDRYHDPVIFVTEGGWSLAANSAAEAAKDPARTYYYANYTSEMLKAVHADGVRVFGYFAWSLLDNFEWEQGYTERFGTVWTDYNFGLDPNSPSPYNSHQPTPGRQLRRRKDSNCWLETLWTSNSLSEPSGDECVNASVFEGYYGGDHGCMHYVFVDAGGLGGYITLRTPAQGTCDNSTDQTLSKPVSFSGGTVSCENGCNQPNASTAFLQGFWSKKLDGVEWGDGTSWKKASTQGKLTS